ncbi:MAG: VCBS repeat-containing protein [Phycisphaerae bacterium]|nr:VCBS repeat-containing protein [Phycisphaerae bacterium]
MIRLFLNNNNDDDDPEFDGGTLLQVGDPTKTNIDVGSRATPTIVDWNNDDKKDLLVGALDGKIHIFINEGTDTEPDFHSQTFAQNSGVDLIVPSARSSPHVLDFDGDGKKDLLVGNTDGQLLLYTNTGTDAAPSFSGYTAVKSEGVAIDLAATRSRPFVADWTDDGQLDVLIGASDGQVYLYQNVVGDMDCSGVADLDDVPLFVEALIDPGSYTGCDINRGEMNGDGVVDGLDVQAFVDLVLGP